MIITIDQIKDYNTEMSVLSKVLLLLDKDKQKCCYHEVFNMSLYSMINKQLKNSFKEVKKKDMIESWVILIDGKRVTTRSKKSLWRSKQHAKTALRNHLDYIIQWSYAEHGNISVRKKVEDQWIEKHAEFAILQEWQQRSITKMLKFINGYRQ